MTRKTAIALAAVQTLFVGGLFGQQEKPWFSADIFGRHSAEAAVSVNSGAGLEFTPAAGSVAYRYKEKRFLTTAGVQTGGRVNDIVLRGVWYPLRTKTVRAGAGGLYHFGNFEAISFEHDLFLGGYIDFQPFEHFYFNADVSAALKLVHIPALPAAHALFRFVGPAVSLRFGTVFAGRLRAEIELASYELFRYHLFLDPTFMLSCVYVFNNGLYAGITAGVRYSDIFTLTSHLDNYFFTAAFGVTL